jgi:putative aminopeptidase FrvX
LRGALPAAQQIQPDIALQIDLILASDTPDMKDFGEVKLGDGPALSMFSFHGRGTLNGVIPHPELVNYIEKTAAQEGIKLQKSAHIGALTDLSYVQLVNEGVVCADLGFPMRYSHSSYEMCDVNDLVGLTQLLVSFVKDFPASFQLNREG